MAAYLFNFCRRAGRYDAFRLLFADLPMPFSFALWAQPGHCSGAMNTAFVVLGGLARPLLALRDGLEALEEQPVRTDKFVLT